MLGTAIEAFNRLADLPDVEKRLSNDLAIIRVYLSDQAIREGNAANGLEYLNKEADVLEKMKAQGL